VDVAPFVLELHYLGADRVVPGARVGTPGSVDRMKYDMLGADHGHDHGGVRACAGSCKDSLAAGELEAD
jgi:hypothetical protein